MRAPFIRTIFIFTSMVLFPTLLTSQTWQQQGPRGGYFKDFAIHPANNQIVFAGSDDSGGIWKSSDGGNTWALVTEELPDMTGWHIRFDYSNANIIYACDVYGRYGIIKSVDGGNNWSVINNGLNSRYDKMVSKIAIDPLNNQNLFISTGLDQSGNPARPGNGVFRSSNGGGLWIPSGMQDTTVTCIAITSNGILFAGTDDKGVFTSADNGITWNPVTGIPINRPIQQIEIRDSVVVVSAESNGIYMSTNNGTSFSNIGLISEFNFDISVASINPDIIIYSTSTTILRKYTSSAGNWSIVATLPTDLLGIGITATATDVYYSVFANTEFWHSSDGGNTFNIVISSPYCTEISSVAVDPQDENHYYASLLGTYSSNFNKECLYETTDAGSTWTRKGPVAHGLCVRFVPGNPSVMYCGTFGNGLYKTTNNFISFSNIRPGNLAIIDINIDPADTSQIFISELNLSNWTFGLYHSSDGGITFNLILPQVVNMIYNSPTSDSLFAATENGLYISPDNGTSWINLYAGSGFQSIAYNNGNVYVGLSTGQLIKAYPTYQNITGSWGTAVAKTILFRNDTMFLGLSGAEQDTGYTLQGGIWYTPDFGTTWINITSNLTTTHCFGNPGLAFSNNNLLMGSYSGGIFEYDPNALTIQDEIARTPILNIYPNPATNSFVAETGYEMHDQELIILNSLGEIVFHDTHVNGYRIFIEGLSLSPGMYSVMIRGNNGQHCRTLIVH